VRLLAELTAAEVSESGGGGPFGMRPGSIMLPFATEMSSARAQSSGMPHFVVISLPGMESVGALAMPAIAGRDEDVFRFGPLSMLGADAGASQLDAVMAQAMHVMLERSMNEEQPPQVHPAQEVLRDALPRVVVTKEDQLDATNSKCAVCLEEFRTGARATRMFCGHLFCTACIREWLRTANTCPICRFELATDSQEYEAGRRQRMEGRVARLRIGELRMMRIPELKQLMKALGVSGEGCFEKADLIRKLGNTPKVEVAEDRMDIRYTEGELRCLEMPQLRCLLERHALSKGSGEMDESQERNEAVEKFVAAGWIKIDLPSKGRGGSFSSGSATGSAAGLVAGRGDKAEAGAASSSVISEGCKPAGEEKKDAAEGAATSGAASEEAASQAGDRDASPSRPGGGTSPRSTAGDAAGAQRSAGSPGSSAIGRLRTLRARDSSGGQ